MASLQLGVGEVQVAAAPADARPAPAGVAPAAPAACERPQDPRLEVAVARVVARPPRPEHLVHGGRAIVPAPGRADGRIGRSGGAGPAAAGGGRRRRGRAQRPSGDRSGRRRSAPATCTGMPVTASIGRRRTARGCGGSSAPRHRSAARGATTPRSGRSPIATAAVQAQTRCRARRRRRSRSVRTAASTRLVPRGVAPRRSA